VTTILEINDFELSLHRGEELLYRAPAIAIVREGNLLFGEPALRQFRLFPQQTNQQYLAKLSADPLGHPISKAANLADLVYLHLKELRALCGEELVLAVPGTLSGEQLGILLGICHEAGFAIRGFVDSAVAAVSSVRVPAQVAHIDMHLQHVVITELQIDVDLQKLRAAEVRDCGAANLMDGWVNLIADRFVHETRFDPMHTADTEQQLYNQVYDWLVGAHYSQEVSIEVSHAENRRRVELTKSQLITKALQRFRLVAEALPAHGNVILSARASRVPGFAESLKQAGCQVEVLAADAVQQGIMNHISRIVADSGDLRLINRLPHQSVVEAPERQTDPECATHYLSGSVAKPIVSNGAVQVRGSGNELWLIANPELRLNGATVTRDVRLLPGDSLSSGAETYTLIRVMP
jgi:hypothetical protein